MADLVGYRRSDLPRDVVAGLSVAAVALPVGVAYAELTGLNPVIGLYASILPLVAYALFGTSRQLIVGPDAATCALLATAIVPLASGDPALHQSLAVTLTFLTGVFCVLASFLKLGGLADFLSRPILVGFLNGVALSILLGQLGKMFGFPMEAGRILPRLIEFASKLHLTHWPTLAVALGTFGSLALASRLVPKLPAPLVAMAAVIVVSAVLNLPEHGVAVVGSVPAGLPSIHWPTLPLDLLPTLLANALGISLIAFSSMMVTARAFAVKNRYEVDADREIAALGAANLASALSQGFAVSGADSRTAINDAAGGRTRAAGLVAACAITLVLMFLTAPLAHLPIAALGAVLVAAAATLVDIQTLRSLFRIQRSEFLLSILVTLGVAAFGAINAILFAVVLALLRFVRHVSRPKIEELGTTAALPGFHARSRHPEAQAPKGIVLFRFNAPLVFFNAPHFRRSVLAAADAAGPDLRWFVIDMLPMTEMDATGVLTAAEVFDLLRERGVTVALAGRSTTVRDEVKRWGQDPDKLKVRLYPTLRKALRAYREEMGAMPAPDTSSDAKTPKSESSPSAG
ncbi:MAG: SulP family inorganic anion transporter [Betaproteobacteria bacterium]|nr:MAG: SulP family inorganic anion transporter [Betaproteobacteria bacterium]